MAFDRSSEINALQQHLYQPTNGVQPIAQKVIQINGNYQPTNEINGDWPRDNQNEFSQFNQSVQLNDRQADQFNWNCQPSLGESVNQSAQINGHFQSAQTNGNHRSSFEISNWSQTEPQNESLNRRPNHNYDHSSSGERSHAAHPSNVDYNGNSTFESNRNNCGHLGFSIRNQNQNQIHNFDNHPQSAADQQATFSNVQTDQQNATGHFDQVNSGQSSPYQQSNQHTNQHSYQHSYQEPLQSIYPQHLTDQSYQQPCQPPCQQPCQQPFRQPAHQPPSSNGLANQSTNVQLQNRTPQPSSTNQIDQNSQNNPNNDNQMVENDNLPAIIRETIAQLYDPDVRVVVRVLKIAKLHLFDRENKPIMKMDIENQELIRTLVDLSVGHDDVNVLRLSAHIIGLLSKELVVLQTIFAGGYLHVALTKLLRHDSLVKAGLSIVHSLVTRFTGARDEVRSNGIPILFRLLDRYAETKLLIVVLETLRLVTIQSQEATDRIHACNGLSRLIRFADSQSDHRVSHPMFTLHCLLFFVFLLCN